VRRLVGRRTPTEEVFAREAVDQDRDEVLDSRTGAQMIEVGVADLVDALRLRRELSPKRP
jgi:hypothetical protein